MTITCPDSLTVPVPAPSPKPGWTSAGAYPGASISLDPLGFANVGSEGSMVSTIQCAYGFTPRPGNSPYPLISIQRKIHFSGEKFWCEPQGKAKARSRSR